MFRRNSERRRRPIGHIIFKPLFFFIIFQATRTSNVDDVARHSSKKRRMSSQIYNTVTSAKYQSMMQFQPKLLKPAEDSQKIDFSLQSKLENVLIAFQHSRYRAFRALVKFHPNVRKKATDIKVSPFQDGKIYKKTKVLPNDVSVETSILPQVCLVPLAICRDNPYSYYT